MWQGFKKGGWTGELEFVAHSATIWPTHKTFSSFAEIEAHVPSRKAIETTVCKACIIPAQKDPGCRHPVSRISGT